MYKKNYCSALGVASDIGVKQSVKDFFLCDGQGCRGQGKGIWKMKFFPSMEKSGNFVDG